MPTKNLTIAVLFASDRANSEILEIIAALPQLDLIGQSADPDDLLELLREPPDLVLIELPGKGPIPDRLIRLRTKLPQTALIAYSSEWEADFLIRTMQAGGRDFLTLPFSANDLLAAIERIFRGQKRGHVIAVAGNKGGVGVTTLAVNLAVALGELTNDQVALVDLGRPFPDIGKFLDQKPTYSLADILHSREEFDQAFIKKIMQPYTPKIEILHGAEDLKDQNELEVELMEKVLGELKLMYKFIIVDLGNWIDDLFMKVISDAEMVILLTGVSIIDLHNIRTLWSLFLEWDQPVSKIKVVVNRYNKNDNIQLGYLKEIIQSSPFITLPSGYLFLLDALNEGRPLGMVAPRGNLWQKIKNLAEMVQQQLEITVAGSCSLNKEPSRRRFWVF